MNKISTILSLSLCTLLLTACQGTEQTSDVLKIGYVGPLTGDAVAYGKDTFNAVKMKVDEVNAAGGINGQTIQLIGEDGRCNGGDSASAAQKLIHVDNVVAVIGGQCSSETLAIAAIAEQAQVVVMSPVSSSADIADAGDFIFRTMPSDALKGVVTGQYFGKQGYTKVAMITENTDYAQSLRNGLKNSLPEVTEVVLDEMVEPGTKDFRSLVARLAETDFDVFFANGQSDATIASMVQQLREQGLEQDIVSQDIADSANLGSMATEAVEGMRLVNTSSQIGTEKVNGVSFAGRYEEQFGPALSAMSFAALAYDAVGVVLEAIENVGTDGPAIRDYLYALENYSGAAGGLHFDDQGEVVGIPYGLKEFQNGTAVEIETIELN